MIDQTLTYHWWKLIQSMETSTLEENATSLSHLHNCEQILGFQPLHVLKFPDIQSTVLSRKPTFKNLDLTDIRYLRKFLLTEESTPELTAWAETLLRYLEINRLSIIKKVHFQYGSGLSGQMAVLELTALMLDAFFVWGDLRYLNLVLKLMDMPGIYSVKSISKNITGQKKKLPLQLIQIRLMVLRQAAIQGIGKS